jgi:hypothetical protein
MSMANEQQNSVLQRLSRDNSTPRGPPWVIMAVLAPLIVLAQGYAMLHDSHGDLRLIGASLGITATGLAVIFGLFALLGWAIRRMSRTQTQTVAPPNWRARLVGIGWLAFALLQCAPYVMQALISGDWSTVTSGLAWIGGGLAVLLAIGFAVEGLRKLDGSKSPQRPAGKPLDMSSL